MLRMRRCRNIRILLYLLLVCGLTYYFLHDDIGLPTPSLPAPKTKYASRATYEHISPYRQHANRTFEHSLDAQLLSLSQTILSSNPTLQANLTIHQITTASSAIQFETWVTQWRTNNPGWGHELLTTHPMSLLSLYSSAPLISTAYEMYPTLQPDLTKYLMLWYYGGFYTDIDTWERVSLKDCTPIVEAQRKDVSLVVGVDRDEPFFSCDGIKERGWSRGFGFGIGTMWAPRRFDPILRKAIVRSTSHAHAHQKLAGGDGWIASFKGTNEWEEEESEEISGAGMFTDLVLEALSEGLKEGHELRDRDAGLERRVSWKKFKGLKRTLWIEPNQAREGTDIRGIAVLPIDVWSNGQNHSSSGTFEAEGACVNHVYGGRSKKKGWYEKPFG